MKTAGRMRLGLPAVVAALLLAQAGDTINLTCETAAGIQNCPSTTAENGVAAFSAATTKEMVTTANTVRFSGNVSPSLNQIVAFRRQRSPALRTDVVWGKGVQVESLTYPAPSEIPLRIWIVCAAMQGGVCTAPGQDYLDELKEVPTHANFRLQYERVGVTLTTAGQWISDETGGPLNAFKDFPAGGCAAFEAAVRTASPPRFQPDAVNVYVVQTVETYRNYGRHCEPWDIVVVANDAEWDLILHETGHILTLQDLPVPSFPEAEAKGNYMVSEPKPGEHREFFAEGQIFRVHFNSPVLPRSLVYRKFPARAPLMRSCGSTAQEAAQAVPPCPKERWRLWEDQ